MRMLTTLLEITIYSTVIFALTMLTKKLLGKRLSPFLHYAIWSLFILRLMLPITFESPVQPFTLPDMPRQAIATAAQKQGGVNLPPADAAPSEATNAPQAANHQPATQTAPAAIGTLAEGGKPSVSLAGVLLAVWLIGAGIGVGYVALLYIRLRRRIAKRAVKPSKRLCALYQSVLRELHVSANATLVCQHGLTSPGVLFPAYVLMPMEALAAMNDEQVKNTLRHELMHLRRGDHVASVLLSLINAVYWFNPIVWIAIRQIRADMETRCDSAVVSTMSMEQKGDYASLILELFSRSRYRPVVLGMACGKSKSVVERRIKGVFMNHKSKWSAKLLCLLITFTMLIGCFTTACVPKASRVDKPTVMSGADGTTGALAPNSGAAATDGKAMASPAPTPMPASSPISPLAQTLGVPNPWRFEQQSADGKALVRGDLAVTLPNVDAAPVAAVVCRDVTEADLMRASRAFFGQDVTFTYASKDTREYAEAYILKDKELYDSVLDGTCENKLPSFHKSVRGQYEFYAAQAKTAPYASEQRALEPVFTERIDYTGETYMGFCGVAMKDGTAYQVSAVNGSGDSGSSAVNIA